MVEGSRRGGQALDGLGRKAGSVGETFDRLNTRTNLLGRAFGALMAVGIAAFFTQAAAAAGSFETAMAEVSTLVDAAVFNLGMLEEAVLRQSRAFGAAPVQQAAAAYQIISAGAGTAAEAVNLLDASNRLAIGGVTDVATAADGLTSVLNAYGMAATQASDVSDVLFVGMRAGKTTIGELSSSLGNVAPLAAQAGVEFDELVASISALTKGGISTQQAVTGVRAILASVTKPTQEASELADELGLNFDAAALASQGFAGFMEDVVTATDGSSDAMAKLFGGVEALVPALALAGQAGADMTAILEDMEQRGGATQEAFEKMTNTFEFQSARLRQSLMTSLIELGTIITTAVTPAIKLLADNFDLLASAAATLATVLAVRLAVSLGTTLVGAVSTAVSRIIALEVALGAATTRAALMSGGIKSIALAFRVLTAAMAANPIGLLLTALSGVAAAMFFFRDSTDEAALAIDNNSLAIGDEIANINALNLLLDSGVQMTVSQAQAKLSEVEARRENIKAMAEEQAELVTQTQAYQDIQDEIEHVQRMIDQTIQNGGYHSQTASPFGAVESAQVRALTDELTRLLAVQAEMVSSATDYSAELEQNQSNIDRIRTALENASNGMVNFNGEVITGVGLSERLSGGMSSTRDLAWEASYGTGALAASLNQAAMAAAVLLSNIGGTPTAISRLASQADSTLQSLVSQNTALTYQVEQGLSSQAAGIKAARDLALGLAAENGATIDEIAALGAAFDEQAARAEELATRNSALNDTLRQLSEAARGGAGAVSELSQAQSAYLEGLAEEYSRIQQSTGGARAATQQWYEEQLLLLDDLGLKYEDFAVLLETIFKERMREAREQDLANATDWVSGIQRALGSIEQDVGTAADRAEEAFKNAFDKSADALAEFAMTGKLDFAELARSIIADIIKMQTRLLLFNALKTTFPGLAFADGGMVPAFADGGKISGPGTGRSDSILARVSNGEYIVNAKATREYLPLLNQINSGRVPAFADGGLATGSISAPVRSSSNEEKSAQSGPTMIFNITTPDAQSFKQSEAQIASRMRRMAQRGARGV